MTKECQDMECNDHDFTRILHFIIDNISPRLSFYRDSTTDFQYYTRVPTPKELMDIKERNLDSNQRGLNKDQELLSAKKRKLAKVPVSPRQKSTSSRNTYFTPQRRTESALNVGFVERTNPPYSPYTPLFRQNNIPGEGKGLMDICM